MLRFEAAWRPPGIKEKATGVFMKWCRPVAGTNDSPDSER